MRNNEFTSRSLGLEQINQKLIQNHAQLLTGLHVQKVYTSLGTSCHNAYTKFFCWLLMHICILIAISH